jgi:hypothetical protein
MKPVALKELVEERKEKAIENLSNSYAKNKLPLEEYERLVEYINKIESERELVVVEKIVAEYDAGKMSGKKAGTNVAYDDDEDDEEDYTSKYNAGRTFANSNVSILSSRSFQGPIKSGTEFFSLLGSAQIRVRKEDLSKRRTVLNVVSILGDCSIYVESGIRVNNKAIPILGSASVNHKVKRETEDEAPELVISGAALLGEISVKLLKD